MMMPQAFNNMEEYIKKQLLGNTGASAASNVIFGKKKTQPTTTANPAAVSPTDTSKISQFSQGLANKTISSPAKDAYVKSQLATTSAVPPAQTSEPKLGVNPPGVLYDVNTGKPLGTSTTPPPTTPEAPKAPTAYETAMSDYIASLKGGDKVTEAQRKYNEFIAARDLGVSNIEGQGRGIPLSLVRGQQAKLQEQAGIESQRLLGEVGIAEGQQKNLVEANKARVDYLSRLETTPAQQLELKKAQAELDKTLAETKQIGVQKPMTAYEQAKFNQDAAQFGKEYALKAREVALKEAEKAPTSTTSDQAINQVNLIKTSLENAKNLAKYSGSETLWQGAKQAVTGATPYTELKQEVDTLRTNMLTLATDPTIKKFFGPQMSNADVQLMLSAGTSLNPKEQRPEVLKKELTRLEGVINKLASVKGASEDTSGANNPLGI